MASNERRKRPSQDYVRYVDLLTAWWMFLAFGATMFALGFAWGVDSFAVETVETASTTGFTVDVLGPGLILGPFVAAMGIVLVSVGWEARRAALQAKPLEVNR